jgi:hypothetical protein
MEILMIGLDIQSGFQNAFFICAPLAGIKGNSEQGAVYVFTPNGTNYYWFQQQKLIASDGNSNDWFGYSFTRNETN